MRRRPLTAALVAATFTTSIACGPEPTYQLDPCHPVQPALVGSWSPPLLPLKVSISTSGRVSVALAAQWVTPLGTFATSGEASHTFAPSKPTSHRLVIRTVANGQFHETGYEINCDRKYRVFLNGTFTAEVDREQTTISAEPNTESVITVVDAESNLDPDMSPLPEFKLLHDRKSFQLPDTLGTNGLGVDLDSLTVGEFVAGSELDSDDTDMWDEYSTGLEAGYHGAMGTTDLAAPSPEQCRDEANKNASGAVPLEQLRVGNKFCVTTSKGNVAFLEATGLTGPRPDRFAITFVTTVWLKL